MFEYRKYNKGFEEVKKYKGKYILCKRRYDALNMFDDSVMYSYEEGEYYLLSNVEIAEINGEGIYFRIKYIKVENINGWYSDFNYEEFLEHFDLRTLQEVRKDKIKSILD